MTQRTLSLMLLAVLAVLGFSACRRGRPTVVGGSPNSISERDYRHLLRSASRQMHCRHPNLSVQEISAGVYSVQGCGQAREYAMVCRGSRCGWRAITPVEQVAMRDARCGYGVRVIPTGPVSRQVEACGRSLSYQLACGQRDCEWVPGNSPLAGVQSNNSGAVVVVPADPSSAEVPDAPVTVVSEPADEAIVEVDAEDTLQSLLATQLDAVRACSGGQSLQVVLQWDADGTVTVHLQPPHRGTPLEQCVQSAIGPVQIQSDGGTGTIQVTL